ncbi:cytochrome c (plasmid) [Deinococcus sp. KNUC1210]|uniref:c-type cytochrome n=1 Tax=Deinococcus sp. KNUC1210 TaxID=2917691 RepID=UPI001EEF9A4D|nr:cytochrome c [Deinococcus sp. KNUC1210]ULH17736.1 cytochrome c [Deinococcus sp. KNUC1210]
MKYLLLLAAASSFASAQNGKSLYTANCAACHQATGRGIPGAFPPLAGHFPDLLAAGGRAYTVRVVLFGLTGAIQVNGKAFNGAMPGFSQLSDAELAAILNEVSTRWGNTLPATEMPYSPAEIGAARGDTLTPAQVYSARPKGTK